MKVINPLQGEYMETGSIKSHLEPHIVIVSNGRSRVLDPDEFRGLLRGAIEYSTAPAVSVCEEAIVGLLRTRDFLGLQLDHAWKNISDDEFEKRSEPYLVERTCDHSLLAQKISVLRGILTTVSLDGDMISAMFGCSLQDVDHTLAFEYGQQAISRTRP